MDSIAQSVKGVVSSARMINIVVILYVISVSIYIATGPALKEYNFEYDIKRPGRADREIDQMTMELLTTGVNIEFRNETRSAWAFNGIPAGESGYGDCEDAEFDGWPKSDDFTTVRNVTDDVCGRFSLEVCSAVLGCQLDATSDNCESQPPNVCSDVTHDGGTAVAVEAACVGASNGGRSYPCYFETGGANRSEDGSVNNLLPNTHCETMTPQIHEGEKSCAQRRDSYIAMIAMFVVWPVAALGAVLVSSMGASDTGWRKNGVIMFNILALLAHVGFILATLVLAQSFANEDTQGSATFSAIHAGHEHRVDGSGVKMVEVHVENTTAMDLLQSLPFMALLSGMLTMLQLTRVAGDNFETPLYAKMMTFV